MQQQYKIIRKIKNARKTSAPCVWLVELFDPQQADKTAIYDEISGLPLK